MAIAKLLEADQRFAEAEGRFQATIYAAKSILLANQLDDFDWPADVARPDADRSELSDLDKAAFDCAWIATAYAFCHEIRHVMFAKDAGQRPARRDEELACDAWAHDFVTGNVGEYARDHGDLEGVLAKRCIAAAISIFVLYETTERSGDAGTEDYPPLADRMNATLASIPLVSNDKFWVYYACVLVAILRRGNVPLDVNAQNARQLCERLVEKIRQKS
jgi:hypothetical protein